MPTYTMPFPPTFALAVDKTSLINLQSGLALSKTPKPDIFVLQDPEGRWLADVLIGRKEIGALVGRDTEVDLWPERYGSR